LRDRLHYCMLISKNVNRQDQNGDRMGQTPQEIGKLLVGIGLLVAAVGAGIWLLGASKLPLFRLPGDIRYESDRWSIWFPITSCIVVSVILTLIVWLVNQFRH
jgi:hypothetical protein